MSERPIPPPEAQQVPSGTQIKLSSSPTPLTVEYAPRTMTVHQLTSAELDSIASPVGSVNLTFFALCFGGLISFGIVLLNGPNPDPTKHAEYIALFAVCAIGAGYFGIRALVDYIRSSKKLSEIKSSRR